MQGVSGGAKYNLAEYEILPYSQKMREAAEPSATDELLEVAPGENGAGRQTGDTVDISQQGRQLAGSAPGAAHMRKAKDDEESQNAADLAKQQLLDQIEDVKEKLQDAQARLAQAQASAASSEKAEPEDDASGEEGDPTQAAAEAAVMTAMGGNPEVEAIQMEIKMLSQQLMTLNQKLMEDRGGSGGAGVGYGKRAGIGGESNGPSGQGQRIEVSA